MQMIIAAQEKGASVEQLAQMMDLQMKWEANEARKAYNLAVSEFRAEGVTITKDKKVGYDSKQGGRVGYSHATLGNCVDKIVPALSKYGLSHSWEVKQDGNQITVTCHLSHCDGHRESVSMTAQPDNSGQKNAIQQVASTVTYLERYTLLAITGLAVTDQLDDDGRGVPSATSVELITEEQQVDLEALIEETGFDTKIIYDGLKINDLSQVPATKFKKLCDRIEQERKAK